jgi:L-aspartate oxidase
MERTEVLIIGSGLAGLITALTAADAGKSVIVVTKTDELMSGSTPYAQGGIIYKGENDSPQKLKQDIMVAGDGVSWEPAVDQLTSLGPQLVKELLIDKYGVDFDTEEDRLDFTEEGAHSVRRIIHTKDKTGRAIHEALIPFVLNHPNIKTYTNHTAVDLLTLSHHSLNPKDIYLKPACFGAYILDNTTGKVTPVYANNTVLATGGLGQIYINTTNPEEATGDGLALAYRAGARLFNLHYVQFHPTTIYTQQEERFLVSESVRGEGAILIDKDGKPFMHKYHELKELAPRDIVARGIYDTMLETKHPCVYLDIRHKDAEWIRNRFPTINNYLVKLGIDMANEPIPVVPAAHYACGGVGVSLKGRTSLRRLYSVGEVSCTGVHGANRLASTSLLEALVWGWLVGKEVSIPFEGDEYFPEIHDWENGTEEIDNALIAQDWYTIKNTMWNYVGLVRTKQRLHRAQQILRHLSSEIESFYREAKLTKEILQLRNGVTTAYAVTNYAIEDRISRGSHFVKK